MAFFCSFLYGHGESFYMKGRYGSGFHDCCRTNQGGRERRWDVLCRYGATKYSYGRILASLVIDVRVCTHVSGGTAKLSVH